MKKPTKTYEQRMSNLGWWILALICINFLIVALDEMAISIHKRLPKLTYCEVVVCPQKAEAEDEHFVEKPDIFAKKWFVYGLLLPDYFQWLSKELAKHQVQVVAGGCVIGTEKYKHDMRSNQRTRQTLSRDAIEVINTKWGSRAYTDR